MKYDLRLLSSSGGINNAIEYINSSDYFRKIEQDEVDQSAFVKIGDHSGYMWFRWIGHESLAGHIMINPLHRGLAINKHVLSGARWICEFMGASRLYALRPLPNVIEKYLLRQRWEDSSIGLYLRIR